MNKFSGEIETYLKSLGLKEGNGEILNAMILAGFYCDFYNPEFDPESSYYCFRSNGVSFLFEKKILVSIFFYIQPEENYHSYINIDSLIKGLDKSFSEGKVIELFGEPDNRKNNWIKYYLPNDKYLHIEFNDQGIELIVLGFGIDKFR